MIPMPYPFIADSLYRRRDVYRMIGISEDTRGGNWDTGYASYKGDWFIFVNVGIAGRTGHDYDNQWVGDDLLWRGKTRSRLGNPSIRHMLSGEGIVYIFARCDDSAPFIFVGCGRPHATEDTVPVTVLWKLEPPSTSPAPHIATPMAQVFADYGDIQKIIRELRDVYNPLSDTDGRQRITSSIVRRQGQPGFRYTMLSAYEGKCGVTRTDVPQVLEAAHIRPYRGQETNHPANGLLLRADIHTLFDLGLLAIKSEDMSIRLNINLTGTVYGGLAGSKLHTPRSTALRPSKEALDLHRAGAGL